MAIIESGEVVDGLAVPLRVSPYRNSVMANFVSDAASYGISVASGTMAAGLGANSTVFMARNSATATRDIQITRIVITWVTITAFSVPLTAGRSLGLFRGSSTANPSGGTATASAVRFSTQDPTSFLNSANGGDIRIASTAALTATAGFTYNANPIELFSYTSVGTAGASTTHFLELDSAGSAPINLAPSQFICLRNPVAMDAGGTWQIVVNMRFNEV
jgi:hypothetical protein